MLSYLLAFVVTGSDGREVGQGVPTQAGDCRTLTTADAENGPASIFGPPFSVPEIVVRIVDKDTNRPIRAEYANVLYVWKWLKYPASERAWGLWDDAKESVRCVSGSRELIIPARTIRPRGWYNGRYTRFPYTLFGGKTPEFDRIEIVIFTSACSRSLIIAKGDIDRYRDATAIVRFGCRDALSVTFEGRNP